MTVEDVSDLRTAPWGCSLDYLGMRPEPDSEGSFWHLEWYGVDASLDSK